MSWGKLIFGLTINNNLYSGRHATNTFQHITYREQRIKPEYLKKYYVNISVDDELIQKNHEGSTHNGLLRNNVITNWTSQAVQK